MAGFPGLEGHTGGMPGADAGDFSKATVSLAHQTGDTPAGHHAVETLALVMLTAVALTWNYIPITERIYNRYIYILIDMWFIYDSYMIND